MADTQHDIISTWSPVKTCATRLQEYAVIIMHGSENRRSILIEFAERELRDIAAAMGFRLVRVEGGDA